MNLIEFWGVTFMLVMCRVGMFVATFPLFRSGQVPRLVKVTISFALSALWLANFASDEAVAMPAPMSASWLGLSLAVARESIIGAMIGYALGLFLLPAQIAGAYLGQEMGLNMAGITDPMSNTQSNALGNLLNSLAILSFLVADFHQLAIGALYSSFVRLPLGEPLQMFRPEVFSMGLADAHRYGLELAGPIGVCLLLTTVLLIILMKISPQLNLFSIGTSLRLGIGLITAFAFLPDMMVMLNNIFTKSYGFVMGLGV